MATFLQNATVIQKLVAGWQRETAESSSVKNDLSSPHTLHLPHPFLQTGKNAQASSLGQAQPKYIHSMQVERERGNVLQCLLEVPLMHPPISF